MTQSAAAADGPDPGAAAGADPGAAAGGDRSDRPAEHYFSPEPGGPAVEGEVRLVVDGRAVLLRTSSGVFSGQRIDPGTTVLLQHAPAPPPAGPLLDLGSGYGPIACALALRAPAADVVAVDVNSRAVELTRSNATRLGLHRIRAVQPDEVEPGLRFAAIYSNPPIRIGKAQLHDLLAHWLDRLEPTGRGYLVVHRHLGSDSLQRWLADQAYPVERVISVRGYRILGVGAR